MKKKGQVTVFIILAILIVGLGSSYFIFKDTVKKDSNVPVELVPIKNFVDSCIESQIEESVVLIGEGGGYYFPPSLSTPGGYTYYFYEGQDYFPSRNKIEEQLTNSLVSKITSCVNDFKDFSTYQIEQKPIEIKTDILDDRIVFDIKFPLKITFGGEVNILEDFGTQKVYVRLGLIHKLIDGLIKNDYYDEDSICLDCFAGMVFENNMDVDILEGGLGNSIFVVSDYNEETNKTFEFIFAA